MTKLQDLFTQARRTQSSSGMGFPGKNRSESKAHAVALVVAFSQASSGSAEAILKAGADGLLYTWNGKDADALEELKHETESARTISDRTISGLYVTGGWDELSHTGFDKIKEAGFQYVVLPFDAPASLLAQEDKELERVVTVPMRKGELYPSVVRNLSVFASVTGVELDFELAERLSDLTIEEALSYRAVREAVHQPAFIRVKDNLSEVEALTLRALGAQGVILTVKDHKATTTAHVKELREVLEKIHQEEKDKEGHPRIKA
jgi:hypothetical protein